MFNTNKYNRSNQQLVAHCFFSKAGIQYENYDKYNQQQEDRHIIDMIEANKDY